MQLVSKSSLSPAAVCQQIAKVSVFFKALGRGRACLAPLCLLGEELEGFLQCPDPGLPDRIPTERAGAGEKCRITLWGEADC